MDDVRPADAVHNRKKSALAAGTAWDMPVSANVLAAPSEYRAFRQADVTAQPERRLPTKPVYLACKRIFDVAASACALAVLSPLLLAVAAAIKLDDGGPAIYTQTRVGRGGRRFKLYKFRSMRIGADNLEKWLTQEQMEEYRREAKLTNDPRITKPGRLLRRSSIDELPQLLSVLRGDMSLVGPRPITEAETGHYTGAEQKLLVAVRPGITGLWQVSGRGNCTYESGNRQRTELRYVKNCSVKLDVLILLKTVKVVLTGKGAG